MAFCASCGSKLEDGTKFCPSCGAAQAAGTYNTNTTGNTDTNQTQGIKVTDTTSSYDKNDIEKNKVLCAVSYISILFFLPLVACPESRFGKFHANQALILLIASVILGAAGGALYTILWALPLIPNFIKTFVDTALDIVLWAAPVAGMIFGIVNAAQGKAKEIPLIGKFNLINK